MDNINKDVKQMRKGIESPTTLFDRIQLSEPEKFSIKKKPGQVSEKADAAAIILAGGIGSRMNMGLDGDKKITKTLLNLSGKPVLTWSMDSFDAVPEVGLIVVVCPEKDFEYYINKVVKPFAFKTPVLMAPAGETRQESAFSGLSMVTDNFDYIIVHDGARPLVPPSVINHTYSVLKGNPEIEGVICAHPCIDTLKVVEGKDVVGTSDRSAFWLAQTPQIFKRKSYIEAHRCALNDGFVGSDDASLIERMGGHIKVVEGKRNNIKLTVPEDYLILASVMQALKIEHGSEFEL